MALKLELRVLEDSVCGPDKVVLKQREKEGEIKLRTVFGNVFPSPAVIYLTVSHLACFSDEAVMHGACEHVHASKNLGVPAEYVYV